MFDRISRSFVARREGREDVLVTSIIDKEGVEPYNSTGDCAYDADAVGDEETGFSATCQLSTVMLTWSATKEFLLGLC